MLARILPPSRTAAQVSSQDVSMREVNRQWRTRSPLASSGAIGGFASTLAELSVQPHDQRVLAVVLVVAGTDAGGAEAEALVHRDRVAVGDPHLEGDRQARRRRRSPPAGGGSGGWRRRRGAGRARRRRSSGARPGRSGSRPGSRAARPRRSRRGRCRRAWRARGRTSPATRARGRSAARSRSPTAGRCRPAAGPSAPPQPVFWELSRSRHRSASGGLR